MISAFPHFSFSAHGFSISAFQRFSLTCFREAFPTEYVPPFPKEPEKMSCNCPENIHYGGVQLDYEKAIEPRCTQDETFKLWGGNLGNNPSLAAADQLTIN